MKRITYPPILWNVREINDNGGSPQILPRNMGYFLRIIAMQSGYYKENLDRMGDYYVLADKLRHPENKTGIVLTNDQYEGLRQALAQMGEQINTVTEQGHTVRRTRWEMLGPNPLSDIMIEYIQAFRKAVDVEEEEMKKQAESKGELPTTALAGS